MLLQRVLTALVLIPLVVAVIFYASPVVFMILLSMTGLLMALEWLQLVPVKSPVTKFLFFLSLAGASVLLYLGYLYFLLPAVVIWILIAVCILKFPASTPVWGFPAVIVFWGLILIPLFALGVYDLISFSGGRALLVYLLCLVWAADTGAYFAGKLWGQHKLLPAVSPGKTWEGAGGGLLFVIAVAAGGFYYFHPGSPVLWFLMALVVAVVSLFGDLFISMLKRRVGVKDTGCILPGHGGVLDRLDSLMAATVFFNAMLYGFGA